MYTSQDTHRLKPLPVDPMFPYSQSQCRASKPSTTVPSPYDRSRHVDRRFPGPLHIPPTPRFLASPSPSPHDSPASTLINTPRSAHHAFRSPSPMSYKPVGSDKLPPIRHLDRSSGHKPPNLSSARWHDDAYSSRYLHSPSPTPSSPESEEEPQRYGYAKYPSSTQIPTPYYRSNDHTSRYPKNPYPETENRHVASTSPPIRHASKSYENDDEACHAKGKFGVRRGSRFFCTYVSPVTGERCDVWDKGWTVFATLSRHAETEHAPEELALLMRGALCYDQAQIITTRDKQERIEENLAQTGSCPDCGTVFSSKRRDSLHRHRQTSACEKAQKRGRPPTKFPKKPKGANFAIPEVDSSGEAP